VSETSTISDGENSVATAVGNEYHSDDNGVQLHDD
jgi:hypothetical protein